MADEKIREKAPYSGGPVSGKPEGVKTGAKLFEQVKDGIGKEPPVDTAPAAATIRETNDDGSAGDKVVANPNLPDETKDAPVTKDTSNTSDASDTGDGKASRKK